MLGIEQEDDIGLPSRAADAMLLEKTLYQVIARAKYMLGKIDGKFVRSEQAIEFREQLALGSSSQVIEASDLRRLLLVICLLS